MTTKSYKKLILTEAAISNLGHTMTDQTVVGILGNVDGGSARGVGHPCVGKLVKGARHCARS